MKVEAKSEAIAYIVTLTTTYLYLTIANLIFTVLSVIIFIFIHTHFLFILMAVISALLGIYFRKKYKKTIKRQIKMDNCYIELKDDAFDCSQISDEGEYEFFHIKYNEVNKLQTLDGKDLYGFALFLDRDAEESYILVDEKKSTRTIAPITFLGYEKDVFDKIYNDLFNKLDEGIELDTKTKWKKPSINFQIIKASIMQVALFVPYIIASIMF